MPVMVLMMVTLLVSGCSSGRGSGMTGPSCPTTNEVNANHTFTVTVKRNSGDGNGFVVAQGATVTRRSVLGNA